MFRILDLPTGTLGYNFGIKGYLLFYKPGKDMVKNKTLPQLHPSLIQCQHELDQSNRFNADFNYYKDQNIQSVSSKSIQKSSQVIKSRTKRNISLPPEPKLNKTLKINLILRRASCGSKPLECRGRCFLEKLKTTFGCITFNSFKGCDECKARIKKKIDYTNIDIESTRITINNNEKYNIHPSNWKYSDEYLKKLHKETISRSNEKINFDKTNICDGTPRKNSKVCEILDDRYSIKTKTPNINESEIKDSTDNKFNCKGIPIKLNKSPTRELFYYSHRRSFSYNRIKILSDINFKRSKSYNDHFNLKSSSFMKDRNIGIKQYPNITSSYERGVKENKTQDDNYLKSKDMLLIEINDPPQFCSNSEKTFTSSVSKIELINNVKMSSNNDTLNLKPKSSKNWSKLFFSKVIKKYQTDLNKNLSELSVNLNTQNNISEYKIDNKIFSNNRKINLFDDIIFTISNNSSLNNTLNFIVNNNKKQQKVEKILLKATYYRRKNSTIDDIKTFLNYSKVNIFMLRSIHNGVESSQYRLIDIKSLAKQTFSISNYYDINLLDLKTSKKYLFKLGFTPSKNDRKINVNKVNSLVTHVEEIVDIETLEDSTFCIISYKNKISDSNLTKKYSSLKIFTKKTYFTNLNDQSKYYSKNGDLFRVLNPYTFIVEKIKLLLSTFTNKIMNEEKISNNSSSNLEDKGLFNLNTISNPVSNDIQYRNINDFKIIYGKNTLSKLNNPHQLYNDMFNIVFKNHIHIKPFQDNEFNKYLSNRIVLEFWNIVQRQNSNWGGLHITLCSFSTIDNSSDTKNSLLLKHPVDIRKSILNTLKLSFIHSQTQLLTMAYGGSIVKDLYLDQSEPLKPCFLRILSNIKGNINLKTLLPRLVSHVILYIKCKTGYCYSNNKNSIIKLNKKEMEKSKSDLTELERKLSKSTIKQQYSTNNALSFLKPINTITAILTSINQKNNTRIIKFVSILMKLQKKIDHIENKFTRDVDNFLSEEYLEIENIQNSKVYDKFSSKIIYKSGRIPYNCLTNTFKQRNNRSISLQNNIYNTSTHKTYFRETREASVYIKNYDRSALYRENIELDQYHSILSNNEEQKKLRLDALRCKTLFLAMISLINIKPIISLLNSKKKNRKIIPQKLNTSLCYSIKLTLTIKNMRKKNIKKRELTNNIAHKNTYYSINYQNYLTTIYKKDPLTNLMAMENYKKIKNSTKDILSMIINLYNNYKTQYYINKRYHSHSLNYKNNIIKLPYKSEENIDYNETINRSKSLNSNISYSSYEVNTNTANKKVRKNTRNYFKYKKKYSNIQENRDGSSKNKTEKQIKFELFHESQNLSWYCSEQGTLIILLPMMSPYAHGLRSLCQSCSKLKLVGARSFHPASKGLHITLGWKINCPNHPLKIFARKYGLVLPEPGSQLPLPEILKESLWKNQIWELRIAKCAKNSVIKKTSSFVDSQILIFKPTDFLCSKDSFSLT